MAKAKNIWVPAKGVIDWSQRSEVPILSSFFSSHSYIQPELSPALLFGLFLASGNAGLIFSDSQ
jgi:hypothetical protein